MPRPSLSALCSSLPGAFPGGISQMGLAFLCAAQGMPPACSLCLASCRAEPGGTVRGTSTLEQFQGKGLAHSAESEGIHGEQEGNPAETVSSSWG